MWAIGNKRKMTSQLIEKAAELMREQAGAYRRLEDTAQQLAAALVNAGPETIEGLVRVGESELLRMRSRLVQIISALTAFADARAASAGQIALEPAVRAAFEEASANLLTAARDFQRAQRAASALSHSGSSFATAFMHTCGVPPTTYRGPYNRRGEVPAWA